MKSEETLHTLNQLTIWSEALETLIVSQMVKEFTKPYGTQMFSTVTEE